MKIKKAIILGAGFGKRLNPLTLKTPKPLLEINGKSLLENTINILIKYGIEEISINTHHLSEKINDFVKKKKFKCLINLVNEKYKILNTGGGIFNISRNFLNEPFVVINPDTIWTENYLNEFNSIEKMFFLKKIKNILLVVKNTRSFDKNLKGDFSLKKNILSRNNLQNNDFIYTGFQIINNEIFNNCKIEPFSINIIWDKLILSNELYGFESEENLLHLTNIDIYKKLKIN
jgi:MurNAc alpha-1-phosphate uridylyltransferase|tara:strand:- start:7031 stop:7726 length:696 start_codon:yes stop_codon:yes gene_type:complete